MIRAICLPLLCLPALHASELLDPLIVTASRSGESASESSYSTAIIDADTLREQARRTLPEALQFTPGILVQKTAHGHGSPFIRGFTGRQNLLLVDGVRINNSTWRSGPVQYWNTIDPYSIDRIELVRSQGSVLYGSDAAGGTLNALTGETAFRAKPAGEAYHTGSASYGYRSSGQGSHIGRIESDIGMGDVFGARIGFTAKEFGDISDSAIGRMRGTGYPEEDLDLRLDWAVDSDSTITLVHQYVDQDRISRWHRTTNNPGWNHDGHITAPGKWSANDYDQERSLTYLRYSDEKLAVDAAIRRWSATISRQNTRDSEFQNRNPDKDDLRSADIDLETMGYDLQFESNLGPGTLVYGIDHYHDETDTRGWKSNLAGTKSSESLPLADDSEYLLTGLFSQYRWDATEAVEITGGLRYSIAEAKLGLGIHRRIASRNRQNRRQLEPLRRTCPCLPRTESQRPHRGSELEIRRNEFRIGQCRTGTLSHNGNRYPPPIRRIHDGGLGLPHSSR
jgi:hemoglobin/transferrin/lactoferrin receptor protein